jgi:hypothetical protein
MGAQRAGWKLETQGVERHRVVVADLPVLLNAYVDIG